MGQMEMENYLDIVVSIRSHLRSDSLHSSFTSHL